MKEIKEFIGKYKKLLPLSKSVSVVEAEKRASQFLEAMAAIVDWKHEFKKSKIGNLSIERATFAQELAKGTGKTVTENKTTAEASNVYQKAREALEDIENDISYLQGYYEIFSAAHVFYRQLAKGESSYV